ncbi:MAG: hypothetical protein M3Z40_10280, partial [Bifidobacterium sp.]|nr:hypothetical protein [Bifidobacterium sp.]
TSALTLARADAVPISLPAWTGRGVAQLMLTLIGFPFFFIGPTIAIIWGLIEGILILTSSTGSFWHRDARGWELMD